MAEVEAGADADLDETAVVVAVDAVPETEDATRVIPRTRSGEAGQPVHEPEIQRDLAGLMFKSPLDPHRRAPESPFPQADHTLPKTGVRPGMPVVYGTKPEDVDVHASEAAALDAQIGPPPADGFVVPAQREGLPSLAKQNREFRAIALGGGAAVVIVVVLGLWGVARIAFG